MTAAGGKLTDVAVTAAGAAVPGSFNADRTSWSSTGRLAFGTRYQVAATADNGAGEKTEGTSAFATAKAAAQIFPAVSRYAAPPSGSACRSGSTSTPRSPIARPRWRR